MKITRIQFKQVKMSLKKVFKIAFAEITEVDTIFIKISTDEGIIGFGEAQPFEPVTGESFPGTLATLNQLASRLIGENPLNIEQIHDIMGRTILGNSSAKAGIDLAIYDIIGKKANLPLYQLIGGFSNRVLTDMTIGIDSTEEMVKNALEYTEEGFKALKIKAGRDAQADALNIRAIRQAVGPDIELRVDANQGWDAKTAVNILNQLADVNIHLVEQPLPAWDLAGNARICGAIPQKLMLDESLHSPIDALNAVKEPLCDVLNIKLMKSAGLFPATAINAIAASANIPCMVGCMTESRLGIAAAAALVASKKNIQFADVDSFYMLAELPYLTGGFTLENGELVLLDKPGLGVDLSLEFD